ncbi:hypothetical protein, partial [Mycobacterium marinum]|uniref:hypothetical protein n=1 Tax=Mycobacterium marinum TaxID=1781 RepID=UPI00356331EC
RVRNCLTDLDKFRNRIEKVISMNHPFRQSNAAYEELRGMVGTAELDFVHIVAPPRSCSTALERALSNSPDIDMQINDPWSIYDSDRERQTYDYILKRITARRRPPSIRPFRVLVKSIADYIAPGEQWDRMTNLCAYTIFLVRQPLLSTESMMRIMAKEVPPNDGYAQRHGYTDWETLLSHVYHARDYTDLTELYEEFFPTEQPIHAAPEMQLPVLEHTPTYILRNLGYLSRDSYAQTKKYNSWTLLLRHLKKCPDSLHLCDDLLKANFACRILGWAALGQHFKRTDPRRRFVVDATMYRALPQLVLGRLLASMGLASSPAVISWGGSGKKFETDYGGTVPYYHKISTSTELHPPTEDPVSLERFPGFVRKELTCAGGAIQTYHKLLAESLKYFSRDQALTILDWRHEGISLAEFDPIFNDHYRAILKIPEQSH